MEEISKNFIENFIDEDLAEGGRFAGMQVHTRFPPEPNGYLHIGHCKALIIDFGTAEKYGGICNLRMDDTNPAKEDTEYVDAIQEDIHWLGFDWGDRFFYGSDYFEKTYEYAVELIKKGLAYVCELTPEQFKEYRGDTVEFFPNARYAWASIPHFYYDYYLYQYATSIVYAASICERITGGEEDAVEDYLAFLKLGASESPEDLLAVAGVDPLDVETYQRALDFFGEMVDEYEHLVDAKLEQE